MKDVTVARKVHPELDTEALRVIQEMPANSWRPGMSNGNPVDVMMNVPVVFKLDD
jgi:protein TonB